MSASPVRLERAGSIALLLIDHTPTNVLSAAVCAALLDALAEVERTSSFIGAVIAGDGPHFIAGADMRAFEAPPQGEAPASLLLRMLDASAKPVVAALHGQTLGGGFELALACHGRIIAPDGFVGLPEVRLGLIPGGGGTQRLTRLVGPLVALDLLISGRAVPADEAMTLGLVDEVATNPRAAAIERARYLAESGQHPRVADRAVPAFDHGAWELAQARVRDRARGALAPVAAADAVASALTQPFAEGLRRERALFHLLRDGPQAAALRYLAHAEQVAARLPALAGRWTIRRVGIVGGGTMGAGIAIAFADVGYEVVLVEATAEAAGAAEMRVRALYDRQLKARRLGEALHDERTGRIRYTHELTALHDADLVIEAVAEDLRTKRTVFRALSGIVRRDTVLASNTSYLDIDLMADEVDAPERVIGLHFFWPAQANRMVEIVRPRRCLPEAIAVAQTVVRRLHKVSVVAGVCEGFIGNRIMAKARAQAEYALEDGALPQDVDAALEAHGLAMGVFAVYDAVGLDIDRPVRQRQAAIRDPRAREVPVFEQLCARGHLGQKAGRGFYLYQNGKRLPDPEVAALIEQASAARGITRAPVAAATIQQTFHAALVNEAARTLAEGVAARPSDIDLLMVHGFGYPAWRGGPLHEADAIGIQEMLRRVEALHIASGPGWEPAPLLRQMAEVGRRFADLNL